MTRHGRPCWSQLLRCPPWADSRRAEDAVVRTTAIATAGGGVVDKTLGM
jgi:hypothetical protein